MVQEIKGPLLSTSVISHNCIILLGWLTQFLPFGDLAYRANLAAVIFGGLCICVFYSSLNLIHRCRMTAVISSLFLMVSHSMWWTTSCKQEHAADAFFISMAIYLYCRLQRYHKTIDFYILFFIAGLGFFNHFELGCILGGGSMALLTRFISQRTGIWPMLWRCALCFIIGFMPYFFVFVHDVSMTHNISNTIYMASGGLFRKFFFKAGIWDGISNYLYLVCFQFPSLYLLPVILGPYFFLKSWKINANSIGIIFTLIPVVTVFICTPFWDKFLYLLPSFIIIGFWSSFAVYKILHHPRITNSRALKVLFMALAGVCLWWNLFFYSHLSRWGENPKSIWYSTYNNNYDYNLFRYNEFLANPDKRDYRDIEDLCNLILEKLPPKAEYWDDDSRLYSQLTAYYQQQYHKRPDLKIMGLYTFDATMINSRFFAQELNDAYYDNKNFFIVTLAYPYNFLLQSLPDRDNYIFREFKLNEKWWIYKLVTQREKDSLKKL